MNSTWFTTDQVRQLVHLLTVVAAAPDTSDEHRYELDHCRSQLAHLLSVTSTPTAATNRPEPIVNLAA